MALVRILVDGYSLLHNWPELAPGAARHSEAARDALVEMLTQYQDSKGTPITVFFDGSGSRRGKPKNEAAGTVEVLFSRAGQTAVAFLVHNCGGTRFSVDSAGTVTDSQGSAGIQLNKASAMVLGIP